MQKIVEKSLLDSQGNNKGYCTVDDFTYHALIYPDEQWTIDDAEQTFYALVKEGSLREIEKGSGKFEPTSIPINLNNSG